MPAFLTTMTDANIQAVDGDPGSWRAFNIRVLEAVARNIDVGAFEERNLLDVTAIPSVWIQYWAFYIALTRMGGSTEFRTNGVAQWRAAIAVLALSEIDQLDVDAHFLRESTDRRTEARTSPTGHALDRHMPSVYRRDADYERRAAGFTLAGLPVAFEAPGFLLCPSRGRAGESRQAMSGTNPSSAASVEPSGAEWFTGITMDDPIELGVLSPSELYAVQSYAHGLKRTVSAEIDAAGGQPEREAPPSRDLADVRIVVRNELDSLISAIGMQLRWMRERFHTPHDNRQPQNQPLAGGREIQLALRRDVSGRNDPARPTIVQVLGTPEAHANVNSAQFRLRTRTHNLPSTRKNGVEIEETTDILLDFTSDNDERPARCRQIFGQYYLNQIRRYPRLLQQIIETISTASAPGIVYRAIDDNSIFEPVLIRLESGDSDHPIGHHPVEFKNTLLPLKPVVLEYLRNHNVAASIRLYQEGDGYRITVRLPLDNPTPETWVTLSRTYRASRDEVVRVDALLRVGTWPDVRYRADGVDRQETLVYVIPDQERKIDIVTVRGTIEHDDRAAVPGRLAEPSTSRHISSGDGEVRRLHFVRGSPVAFECQVSRDVTPDHRPANGLMLVRRADSPMHQARRGGRVSIDFGTISTAVLFDTGVYGEPTQLLNFEAHVAFPGAAARDLDERLQEDLIPNAEWPNPIRSILRSRSAAAGNETAIGWNEHVYYVARADPALRHFRSSAAARSGSAGATGHPEFHHRLKWIDDLNDRGRITRFLSQIVYQSCLELVARHHDPSSVSWRFSYPHALGEDGESSFRRSCQESVGNALRALGCSTAAGGASIDFRYEAECAAYYFFLAQEFGGFFDDNALIIDIGGETTDISYWQQRSLRWQGSMRLAGGDFITRYLLRNAGEVASWFDASDSVLASHLRALHARTAAVSRSDWGEETVDQDHLFEMELLINSYNLGNQLFDIVQTKVGVLPSMQRARLYSAFCLYAILYHVGQSLHMLTSEGNSTAFDGKPIHVALCGRGAYLMHCFFNREDPEASRLEATVRQLIQAKWPSMNLGRVQFSDPAAFKYEVVRGLGFDMDAERLQVRLSRDNHSSDVPIGLPVGLPSAAGGRRIDATAGYGSVRADLVSHYEGVSVDFTELADFVARFASSLDPNHRVVQTTAKGEIENGVGKAVKVALSNAVYELGNWSPPTESSQASPADRGKAPGAAARPAGNRQIWQHQSLFVAAIKKYLTDFM